MSEEVGKMSFHEWKTLQKYKEEYHKICQAEDQLIAEWAAGLPPRKKSARRKKDE